MPNTENPILQVDWKGDEAGPFKTALELGGNVVDFEELEAFENSSTFIIPPVEIKGKDLSGPLYNPGDLEGFFLPHLSDTLSGVLTADAWDWQSNEMDLKEAPATGMAAIEAELTKDKRGCVVWNLFETEQNYMHTLAIIQNAFKKKMLKQAIITDLSANMMFAGITELYEFHISFAKKMETVLSDWDTTETGIGALFVEHVEELKKLYIRFIDNYSISQKCIKKEEKENAAYTNFMKEAAKSSETNRQTLKDILITPVQRTTRYHLLLKDLLKSTTDDHPDHRDLQHAWKIMADLATIVNDKKRKEEEATGLFEAFEQTKHCPPTLISHRRRLILTADATCPKSSRAIRLVLCSDLLMISLIVNKSMLSSLGTRSNGPAANEYNYRFLRWLDLLEIETVDMHAIKPNTIRITHNAAAAVPSRKSNSSIPSEIPAAAKDLGAASFSLVFSGYDPIKSRTMFMQSIEQVTKSCREELDKPPS